MKLRILVSLELTPQIAAVLPGVDELDIAYACARAGADGLILPLHVGGSSRTPLTAFDREGLPLLCVHVPARQLDRLSAAGSAPDRLLISEDGKPVASFDELYGLKQRLASSHQEIAVLVEPEPQALKQAIKAQADWVAFSTYELQHAETRAQAEQELLRLRTACGLAARSSLRVMIYGDIDRHLASALANIEGVEELAPVTTLWTLALRHGWENAVGVFQRWIE